MSRHLSKGSKGINWLNIENRNSDYNKLYRRWRRKLKKLQEECPHDELTDWYLVSDGEKVRFCANCQKEVEGWREDDDGTFKEEGKFRYV